MLYFTSMDEKGIKRIGLIVELSREFGRDLCKGVTEYARERGDIEPVFVTPRTLRRRAMRERFDGFIARVMTDTMAADLMRTGCPVVDVFYEKPHDGFAVVKTNHARVGRLAADHFISRRFTNFAFCGFADGRSSNYCLSGFRQALKKAGFTCDAYQPGKRTRYSFDSSALINEQLDRAPDENALLRWLEARPKPLAVFCPNDLRAWQLLQICAENDIDVPHQVAILGLDNDVLVCGFAHPMISSVNPDTAQIGRTAAQTLMEMIANPRLMANPPIRHVNPLAVVERASTEVFPIDPPWLSDALIYIHKHIAEGITASDLFHYLKLSHTCVDAAFREKLNTTVQREIAATRLARARELLEMTTYSAAEVAARAGYASATYFMRRFTEAHGLSPQTWRRAHCCGTLPNRP